VVTATFAQTSFPLNSGAVVVKIKLPQVIPSLKLAFFPVRGQIAVIRRAPKSAPQEHQRPATFAGQFYDKYWREKSHIITGDALTGFSENRTFLLGNILTQQIRKITLYNSREISPIEITSVVLANAGGITLDDVIQPDFASHQTGT